MYLSNLIAGMTGLRFMSSSIVPGDSAAEASSAHADLHALTIPSAVKDEHRALHETLDAIIRSGGRTAVEAQRVQELLRPHFTKEESFALPPLGALASLAAGLTPPGTKQTIEMADRLKTELPQMLQEHRNIVAALQDLREAAAGEGKLDAIGFASHLMAHAAQEEQILYPSAILAGMYLRSRRRAAGARHHR